MDDELRFSVDISDVGEASLRTKSQNRAEASTANELVRRLSIYQAASTRIAPTLGSGDPTRELDESRRDDPRDGNDSPSPFMPAVTSPLIIAPRHLRKQSLFFVEEDDDDGDDDVETPAPGSTTRGGGGHHREESGANQISWLDTPLSPKPTTGRNSPGGSPLVDLNVVDRFDDDALVEYGRAANEHVFDIWLDLGERTTLADRMDWDSASRAADHSRHSTGEEGGGGGGYMMSSSHMVSEFSARRVDRQVVGTGLGAAAIASIVEGRFDPATVLPGLIGSFWNTIDDATYLDACIIEVDKNDESMPTLSITETTATKNPSSGDDDSSDPSPTNTHGAHRRPPMPSSLEASGGGGAFLGVGMSPDLLRGSSAGAEHSARRRSIRTRSVVALESFFEVYRRQDSPEAQTAAPPPAPEIEKDRLDDALSILSDRDGLVSVVRVIPIIQPPIDVVASPVITVQNDEANDDHSRGESHTVEAAPTIITAPPDAATVPLSDLASYKFELSLQRPSVLETQESMSMLGLASVTSPHIKLPRSGQDSQRVLRKSIVDHRPQIARSISDTILKLSEMLSPFSFFDFLTSCTQALSILNDGDPDCVVTLSIQPPGEAPLVGAEQVMMYVKTNIFERAQEIGSSINAAEWVLRYTIAFVNAQVAVDEADALAREDILSECVQLLSDFKMITTTVLSLGSKSRHYEEFAQLREWTEAQADALITPIEDRFDVILRRCPFPDQRALLKRHYKNLEHMTVNAVKFLCGFDCQWSSTIPYHAEWKSDFLNRSFLRLHGDIATSWMAASLGFVDPILTLLVKSDHGQNPHEFRKRISMAAKVEYMVAVEGISFYNVAITCKGVASTVVGLQLCMGSRYLLDETTNEHDEKWGFSMCDGLKTSSSHNGSPATTTAFGAPRSVFGTASPLDGTQLQAPLRREGHTVAFCE